MTTTGPVNPEAEKAVITHQEVDGPTQTVLVVDDDPSICELITKVLTGDGYQVVVASRGDEGLAQVRVCHPDIIPLDVAMPGMNGIEVCRRLHSDPETAHLPVLMITGHRRRETRLEGIAAGARDFLLKPLDIADFRVRVRNAGEMKRLYDESEQRFKHIKELENLRDSLVHMIVHDLKSPLSAVLGNLQLMEMSLPGEADSDIQTALADGLDSAWKMNEMVRSILEVSKLESGEISLDLEETALGDIAEQARSDLGPEETSRVSITESPAPGRVRVLLDIGMVQRVFMNLLANALAHSPEEHPVLIHISQDDTVGRVRVVDKGPGIPEEFREKVFEKFGQIDRAKRIRRGSVGLGLAFCKLAVEAHGGCIGIEESEGGGSTLWFELPIGGPEAEEAEGA
jgi:signal transduction histidine kinase